MTTALNSKPLVTDYLRCNAAGLLTTHADAGGKRSQWRVPMDLWSKFVTQELTAEQRSTLYQNGLHLNFPSDEFGYLPDPFEIFLERIGYMAKKKAATTAAKKKAAKAPKALARPEASVEGAGAGDQVGHDPAQKPLNGMEEDRIPTVESKMKQYIENKKSIADLKEQNAELVSKIGGILIKNDRTRYKCLGKVVVITEGESKVEIKDLKAKAGT